MTTQQVIDIHCHRECKPAMEMMKAEAERVGHVPLSFGSELSKEVNRQQLIAVRPQMESLDVRLADMDRMEVDIQAVSVAVYQYYYWAAPEVGLTVTSMINDELAEAVATHPDRFVGLGTVPLQDTDMALIELRRCVEDLGFRGIEIPTNVNGEELSAPRLEPFWEAVEELGIVVVLHPTAFTHLERFADHNFINIIGHPLDETLAISRLIFDGVMERYPGLQFVVVHGGGFLPMYAGRMDHAYRARRDAREALPRPPSSYLRQFYLDTMVFEPDQLGFLIEKYGADHIVLGTDYPYDMGETDPLGLIRKVPGLSEEQVAAISGGNAARLLGIAD
jgi:aminocarboxymuconate-semialdehyde decarboxylase